ncbi:unnamed protein product, partial [marine sediment metagenome]
IDEEVPTDGNFIDVVFDEKVTSVNEIFDGWTYTRDGGLDIPFDSPVGAQPGTHFKLHCTEQIKADEVITMSFTSAGNGDAQDIQGNPLADIVDRPVPNGSTQGVPTTPPVLTGASAVQAAPEQVDLQFSEPVIGTVAGWSVDIDAVPVTGLALIGAVDTRTLTFTETIQKHSEVIVLYVEASGDMTDTAGLPLANSAEQADLGIDVVSLTEDYTIFKGIAQEHDYAQNYWGNNITYAFLDGVVPGMSLNVNTGLYFR